MSLLNYLTIILIVGVVWIISHIVKRRRGGAPILDLSFERNASQIGIVLLIVAAIGGWSAMEKDTSIETGFGRVNNLGLMASQQNQIILFGFLGVVGVLLVIFAKRR